MKRHRVLFQNTTMQLFRFDTKTHTRFSIHRQIFKLATISRMEALLKEIVNFSRNGRFNYEKIQWQHSHRRR